MLDPEDLERIKAWNTNPIVAVSRCIHEFIEDHARERPNSLAVDAWDISFTYSELIDASDKLAGVLQKLGVVPETIVPLLFEKSGWTVLAMVAVLRAGGAFMCLDPGTPDARLRDMLLRANSTFGSILCSRSLQERCETLDSVGSIVIDAESLVNIRKSSTPLARDVSPENRSIIQHTSGSTGVPKGIEVTHRSYCTAATAHGPRLGISPETRIYQFSSYSFDACLGEIATGLVCGACICVPAEEDRMNRLPESITNTRATWIFLTPTLARLVKPTQVRTLKTLVTGGEPLDKDIITVWSSQLDLIQVYGPSECGVYSTTTLIENPLQSPSNIGHAVSCRTWVVDPDDPDSLASVGSVGELIIESPTVARGYLNLPAQTQSAFLGRLKWAPMDSASLYRTGDLVRYDSDGALLFVGRRDTQIKHNGQRIELTDIEFNLCIQPHVKACVVLYPSAGPYAKRIVALLELSQIQSRNIFGSAETLSQIREVKSLASEGLPTYMVPTDWLSVPEMPLNRSTKIDRMLLLKELEQMDTRLPEEPLLFDRKAVPMRDPDSEDHTGRKVLAEACGQILNLAVSEISFERGFISQGGDSILAMSVVALCRENNLHVTVKDILKAGSLQLVETRLEPDGVELSSPTAIRQERYDELVAFAKEKCPTAFEHNIEGVFPCSPAQVGILLSQSKDGSAYSTAHTFEVSSESSSSGVSLLQFSAAWTAVVQRHQALRTIFVEAALDTTSFLQVVCDRASPEIIFYEGPAELYDMSSGIPFEEHKLPHRCHLAQQGNRLICRLEMSHAIIDGISMQVIFDELALAYERKLPQTQGPPYTPYVSRSLHLPDDDAMDYWQRYLVNVTPCQLKIPQQALLELNELKSVQYSIDISQNIQSDLGKIHNISIATLLQAAWAVTLSLYTGQQEVSFAYVTAGRDEDVQGIESAVGAFAKSLISRVDLSPGLTAIELLRAVKHDVLESSTHQHVALADVLHKLNHSSPTLFNTAITVVADWKSQNTSLKFGCIEVYDPTEYDLAVTGTVRSKDNVHVHLDYWTASFSEGAVRRVGQTLQTVVLRLAENLDESIENLDMLSAIDMAQLRVWNRVLPSSIDTCIHEVIQDRATLQGNAAAICSWDFDFTYYEIEQCSTKFAFQLQGLGVPPKSLIPICMEKSALTIVALLSVLKIGCGFILLDPSHPKGRLLGMCQTVGASFIVVSPQCAGIWRDTPLEVVTYTDSNTREICGKPKRSEEHVLVSADDVAYVVFTSGSTGKPKGIAVQHGAYCSTALARASSMMRDSQSRHLQFASYSFDMSLEDILLTLMVGGCVCIPCEDERSNLAVAINRMRVNTAELTPSVASMLDPAEVPSLKVLLLGGERVSSADLQRWSGSVAVINAYGPSECSVTSVVSAKATVDQLYPSNIGRASGALTWVVNPSNHSRLAPIGAVGELLLEGPGLAVGYLGEPEKTDASFIRLPGWLSPCKPERRFYKTGDLVQYLPDGSLIYIGRRDSQVKLRGQRIELGEIDTRVLSSLPWSTTVVTVLATPSMRPDNPLIATFFTPIDRKTCSSGVWLLSLGTSFREAIISVDSRLSEELPSFMLPKLYIPITSIPTSVAGKVDRKRLISIVEQLSIEQLLEYGLSATPSQQPETRAEQQMQKLWCHLLKLAPEEVGVDSNFYRLGGDSVLTMRLSSIARKEGLGLAVKNIFSNPVLRDMARVAEVVLMEYTVTPGPFELLNTGSKLQDLLQGLYTHYGFSEDEIADVYPCTPLQEGLVALSMRQENAYMAQLVHSLNSEVDIDRLQVAWGKVTASNAIFNTRIVHLSRYGSLQVVLKRTSEIERTIQSGLSPYMEADKKRPMNDGNSLSRCAIVTEGDKQYLVWTIHHAIYDGWILGLMLNHVSMVYRDQEIPATPPFNRFIGYLQREQRMGGWEQYWRNELRDFPLIEYPTRPSVSYSGRVNRSLHFEVNIEHVRPANHTLATVVRAAWALVMAHYSECMDVSFGATVTGRNAPVAGIDNMIGPTLATVPIRIDISRYELTSEYLDAVQSQMIQMIPHEHDGIQNIKLLDESCQNACNFQNLLVVQPQEINTQGVDMFGPLELIDVASLSFHTYPLVLGCAISKKLHLHFSFDANMVSVSQVEQLASHFGSTVRELATASDNSRLDDIQLFGDFDMSKIYSWKSEEPVEQNVLIHDEIAKQVASQPEAEAIYSHDRCLSYGQLDDLSTELAQYLKERRLAAPDALLPILLEKSSWVPIAMLAVLKAGAGFVPLDISHPALRLKEIIDQVNPPVVLISEETVHLSHVAPATLLISQRFFDVPLSAKDQFLHNRDQSLTNENSEQSSARIDSSPMASPTESSFSILSRSSVVTSSQSSLGHSDELQKPQSANLAYAIFTSGSTGKPKGVLIEHRQFCSGVIGPRQVALLRSKESRVLQFASLSFDTSLEDILTTLLFGGCVCIPSEHDRINDIVAFINKSRANTAHITPSFANTLSPKTVPTLKYLRLGGERMTPSHITTWADALDLRNVYGPTETSITATCSTRVGHQSDCSNIGKGVAASIWIVNPRNHDQLTPLGLVGEMLVEGPLLARGYLNDTEKTDKSFIVNPAWATTHGKDCKRRFYKTGDLCRYDSDGDILYIGRKDTQVKIYGQRIELGEVEDNLKTALRESHEIAVEAWVPPGSNGHKLLVAFICLGGVVGGDEGQILQPTEENRERLQVATFGLDATMSRSLPKYMIPSRFIPITSLPTTISKKTDRKRLQALLATIPPDYFRDFAAMNSSKLQPKTSMELKVQSMWASVLGTDTTQVGLDDNFLRLGGDSIMAIKLASALRDASITISVADIFKSLTLQELSLKAEIATQAVPMRGKVGPFSLLPDHSTTTSLLLHLETQGIYASEVEDAYPCTPLQEGLLSLSAKERNMYISQGAFTLPGDVDLVRFRDAWRMVVDDNEILRTRMVNLEPFGILQVVLRKQISWPEYSSVRDCLDDCLRQFTIEGELIKFGLCRAESEAPVFVLTIHHSLYDGWCYPDILRQVDSAYKGSSIQSTHRPKYAEFIRHLQAIPAETSKQFWSTKLNACQQSSDLPMRQRPIGRHSRSMASLNYSVASIASHTLRATPSILIRAAWALVIATYSGSTDVVYGASLVGRNTNMDGIEAVVGPTLTTIPVRARLTPELPVSEFIQDLVKDMADTIPFEHFGLQNICGLNPDIRRICDFNSLLVVQPPTAKPTSDSLFNIDHRLLNQIESEHPYPVTITCQLLESNGLDVWVRYDTSVIVEERMLRMLQTFEQALYQICHTSPSTSVLDLDIISKPDADQIQEWNSPQPVLCDTTVQDCLELQLKTRGTAQALYSSGRSILYDELDTLTGRLSVYLGNDLKVGRGDHVLLLFDKSVWHTISMISVIRSGATLVPLDPMYVPEERLRSITAQCQAKVILTSDVIAGRLPAMDGVATIRLSDQFLDSISGTRQSVSAIHASPTDTFCVIFTSGTTGEPKGVQLSHRAFMSILPSKTNIYRIDSNEQIRTLQFVSNGFDISVDDILVPLLNGGCVCVPEEEVRFSGIEDFIIQSRANFAKVTPSACSHWDSPRLANHLKGLLLAGERITDNHIQQWNQHVKLRVSFCPTETCDMGIATDVWPLDYGNASRIGRSAGALPWVVNTNDVNRLVPIGAIGELCVQGPGIADGYINNPVQTAKAFIHPPAWAGSDHRVFKTGDLVKYEDDGELIYIGRKDSQVKLRGLRIELGEIEHRLSAIRSLKHHGAVVDVVRPSDKPNMELLVVFIANFPENTRLEVFGEITQELPRFLPPYMIPTALLPIADLPLSSNGKIDRRRLREIGNSASFGEFVLNGEDASEPPETETEIRLLKIYADLLHLDPSKVGRNTNFFTFGDSITAMRLIGTAKAQGLYIKAIDVFEARTLKAIAKLVESRDAASSIDETVSPARALSIKDEKRVVNSMELTDRDRVEKITAATDFQAWCIAQSGLQSGGWQNQFTYRSKSALNNQQFQAACHKLVQRHEILRTRFVAYHRNVLQVVMAFRAEDYPIQILDGQNGDAEQRVHGNKRLLKFSVDLAKSEVNISINHALYDGICLVGFQKELEQLCNGARLPPPQPFSSLTGISQRDQLTETRGYWRNLLRKSNDSSLVHHRIPSYDYVQCSKIVRDIPLIMPKSNPWTPATIIKSAWALLLARMAQTDDVVFGSLTQTRDLELGTEGCPMGPCLNILPIRVRVRRELLKDMQRQHFESMPHANMGFRQIVQDCTDWPRWTRFSSIVQYQNFSQAVITDDGIEEIGASVPEPDASDIWIIATPKTTHLELRMQFCPANISTEFGAAMMAELCKTIEKLSKANISDDVFDWSQPLENQPEIPIEPTFPSQPVKASAHQKQSLSVSKVLDIVNSSWEFVFGEHTQLTMPFWDIWGDMIVAKQLAELYGKRGVSVTAEEIFQHPRMIQQLELIATSQYVVQA
ncbi:putative Nonribosomal peptide synthetase easA [Seiridium unicorne]|uniref:Nonribosomal peptide synthetase easA n=1 Tax=Seiridium unicorne TaxID=138068 RepID=A0ABR2VE92_9PEZI